MAVQQFYLLKAAEQYAGESFQALSVLHKSANEIRLLSDEVHKANLTEFNPDAQLTQPPSCCQSTRGHTLGFGLTSDGHYYLPVGNNNLNVVLMTVIMLGTHSPDGVLIAMRQPQQGGSELTSKV